MISPHKFWLGVVAVALVLILRVIHNYHRGWQCHFDSMDHNVRFVVSVVVKVLSWIGLGVVAYYVLVKP